MTFVFGGTLVVLLGLVSPLIISLLTKASMSARSKQLVALGVTIVLAIIVAFVPGLGGTAVLIANAGIPAFLESVIAAIPLIYTIQQVIYQFVFKGTEWAENLLDNAGLTDNGTDEIELEVGEDLDGAGLDEDSSDETVLSGSKGD